MSIELTIPWDHCLLCGGDELEAVSPPLAAGITSDCKPWPVTIQPCLCSRCGHVQKRRSEEWLRETEAIYAGYSICQDQSLISEDGIASRKSTVLSIFLENMGVPEKGRLLDVGCGNGNFFPFFNEQCPGWEMYGSEYNSEFRNDVLSIPGVKGFHDGPFETAPDGFADFDFVTQFFVIEHLTDPLAVLRDIRKMLKPDGLVLIHTDDLAATAFDLTVTDHASHFVLETLVYAMRIAGFEPVIATDAWVPKQISVVARAGEPLAPEDFDPTQPEAMRSLCTRHLEWLQSVQHQAEAVATSSELGILGTAVAGTWLANTFNGSGNYFFVDEAPDKIAGGHMGRPVYDLAGAPAGSTVYVAFPAQLARPIRERVSRKRPDIHFMMPPSNGEAEEAS